MSALSLQVLGRITGIFGIGVFGVAVAMQAALGLTPCPLCILQRYCLIGMTLFCLVVGFAPAKVSRVGLALAWSAAIAGVVIAGRQVFLQSMPTLGASCGPGLAYLVNSFPWTELLPILFKGTGDCAQVEWTWHGVTVAKLSLMAFAIFTGVLSSCFLKTNRVANAAHRQG